LQFIIGIAAAWWVRNRVTSYPVAWAAFGIVAFFTISMMENANLFIKAGLISQISFGLAAAVILVGLSSAEQQGFIRINPIGAFFGAASYSLYLVHTVIIGLTARTMAAAGVIHRIPGWFSLIIVVVASLVGGALVHAFIERPIMTRLHHPAGQKALQAAS
jgi:exopolysaccharide production protein ExoZ